MTSDSGDPVATEAVSRQTLPPKPRAPLQTVCDEPGEKDNPCFGHLKRYENAPRDLVTSLAPGAILFRCHKCYRLYSGEPMKFVR